MEKIKHPHISKRHWSSVELNSVSAQWNNMIAPPRNVPRWHQYVKYSRCTSRNLLNTCPSLLGVSLTFTPAVAGMGRWAVGHSCFYRFLFPLCLAEGELRTFTWTWQWMKAVLHCFKSYLEQNAESWDVTRESSQQDPQRSKKILCCTIAPPPATLVFSQIPGNVKEGGRENVFLFAAFKEESRCSKTSLWRKRRWGRST